MASKLSKHIRSFAASSFINSFKVKQASQWVTSTSYPAGSVCFNSNTKYITIAGGTSGGSAPTHQSGSISDGGVTWQFVEVIEPVNTYKGNLYVAIGHADDWVAEPTPDTVSTSDLEDTQTLYNTITYKALSSGDFSQSIRRVDWTTGTVYAMYNPSTDLFNDTSNFFIVTDDNNIYKCLDNNNGGQSTAKPTGKSINNLVLTADGYVWKFMGEVTSDTFVTDTHIPVEYKFFDDGSVQYLVQNNAKKGSVSAFNILSQTGTFVTPSTSVVGDGTGLAVHAVKDGSDHIRQVIVDTEGQDYTTDTYVTVKESSAVGSGATVHATIVGGVITGITVDTGGTGYTSNPLVIIVGDGSGATATSVRTGNVVSSFTIGSGGTGYTWAKIFVIAGSVGAVAKAIMAPANGHGSNILSELNATNVTINVKLLSNAHLQTGVGSDFRQISLITDLKNYDGSFANASHLIGTGHPEFTNNLSSLNKAKAGSGVLLYLSNIAPVTRSVGQEEQIKVTLTF